MSNRERGNFPGAIHHVWVRGNNREYIFENDLSKGFFIKQLKDYKKKFDYNIFAYVVMDNHYHILIQTFKDSIGDVMFNINNVTGKFVRDNLGRCGHVYAGRYNSRLVHTNENLLWLIRYIHRNPVRAKMCERVADYRWSSHFFYLKGNSSFINVNLTLSMFDSNRKKALESYLRLMNSEGKEESAEKDFEFFQEELTRYKGKDLYPERKFELPVRLSIKDIINSFELQPEALQMLLSGSRKRNLTNIKIAFIQKALKEKYTLSEIAAYLNTTQPALSNLVSRNGNKL
jgi:putative transposase